MILINWMKITHIQIFPQKILSTTDTEVWMLESKLKDRYLFKEQNGVSKYTMPLVCSVRVYVHHLHSWKAGKAWINSYWAILVRELMQHSNQPWKQQQTISWFISLEKTKQFSGFNSRDRTKLTKAKPRCCFYEPILLLKASVAKQKPCLQQQ